MTEILTVGHSNHDIPDFLRMLQRHGIRLVVDVRSDPYSRYAPQFNKHDIQRHIEAAGIEYRYSGAYIGGKPKDPSLYTPSGKPDYDKLAATPEFENELRAVVDLAAGKRTAIMCSEADPAACHRDRILAPVLRSWGVQVTHIMPDGGKAEPEQTRLF